LGDDKIPNIPSFDHREVLIEEKSFDQQQKLKETIDEEIGGIQQNTEKKRANF